MPWRFLDDPPQSAAMNMAIDEAIAMAFSRGEVLPTIRFYGWDVPSLSIGSFQKLDSDLTELMAPLPWVRRMTGGRALLHDREVTYSVVAGLLNPLFSGGLKGTFQSISEGLMRGLKRLGVDAEIHVPQGLQPSQGTRPQQGTRPILVCQGERPPRSDGSPCGARGPRRGETSPFCFESTSWYEITVNQKKLIGSAQRRWPTHFLQQGSLVIEQNHHADKRLAPKNQTTLSEILSPVPGEEEIRTALKEGFKEALSIELIAGVLTDQEKIDADRLVDQKYGHSDWNCHRLLLPEGSLETTKSLWALP